MAAQESMKYVNSRRGWFLIVSAGLLLAGALAAPADLPAQTPLHERTALKYIPDDAAFYTSSLRLRQQFETVIASKAFARLREFPSIKSAVEEFQKGWAAESSAAAPTAPVKEKNPERAGKEKNEDDDGDEDDPDAAAADADWSEAIRSLKEFWNDPENQKLVGVGLDAVSHEIFFYGDSSIVEFLNKIRSLNVDLGALGAGGLPGNAELSPDNAVFKAFLDALDRLPVPAFVVGFRLSDQASAAGQLARLEKAVRAELQEFPALESELRREKVGPGEFLTLKLDGSKVPWEELIDAAVAAAGKESDAGQKPDNEGDDPQNAAAAREQAEKAKPLLKALAARLKSRSLTLSLGLYDSYLLFSFGETNAHLAKFSGKSKRLIDRPELAPLLKFADKPLTGISYTSQEVARAAQKPSTGIDSSAEAIEKLGEQIGLDAEARAGLIKDLKALEAAGRLPEPGAVVEWQYLTPRGYEGYSYNFGGGDKSLDGSKKLTILEHVGGDPLIVVAARHKGQVEGYRLLSRTLAVVAPHLDTALAGNLPPPYDTQYAAIKEEFAPLLEKFHTITLKQFLPALAEGQSAFVLDAKPAPGQLNALLPPAAAPLLIPAPALVYGVSDEALLRQACGGYFGLLQETVNTLARLYPEQIPAILLPPPAERDAPGGKLYVYAPPGAEEGEHEIAATGAVGANVAVLSLVPEQAKRFLEKTRFAPAGVLARSDQPAARVWYVNFAGLIDMIQPWVDYGFNLAVAFAPAAGLPEASQPMATVFEVLKCWRGSAGITYFDGKALVEFSESVYEDLK